MSEAKRLKDGVRKELKIGAFFLAGVLAVLVVLEFAGTLPFFSNYKDLNIYFDSVAGLEEGALVKMEGVRVGSVKSIGFSKSGDRIKVKVGLKREVPLKKNTVASIRLGSLLGTSYINLSIGGASSPSLPPGVSINGNSPHDFDKIIQDAGEFIKVASSAAARLNSILTKVDEGNGTVGRLINEDDLYLAVQDTVLKAHASLDTIEDLAPVSFIATVLGVAGTFY